MSTSCSVPEAGSLEGFVQQHPNCVVFIKGVDDTSCNELMETLRSERKRPVAEVAWISMTACPAYIGRHKIRGDRNIVIYYHGQPIKRIMGGMPTLDSLISTMREVMTNKRPPASAER